MRAGKALGFCRVAIGAVARERPKSSLKPHALNESCRRRRLSCAFLFASSHRPWRAGLGWVGPGLVCVLVGCKGMLLLDGDLMLLLVVPG